MVTAVRVLSNEDNGILVVVKLRVLVLQKRVDARARPDKSRLVDVPRAIVRMSVVVELGGNTVDGSDSDY